MIRFLPILARALLGGLVIVSSVSPLSAQEPLSPRNANYSLVEEEMRRGFNMGWWGEFDFYNHGLADTFGPWVVGHLLPVSHLERLLDGEIFKIDPGVTLTGVLFLCLLAFLTGGILDRYSPLACVGLYLCLFAVSVLVLSLYVVVAPGPNQGTVLTIVLTFLVSQAYIVARITTRLWFLASQMNLFRSSEDGASFINKLPRNTAGKISRSALAVQASSDRTSP